MTGELEEKFFRADLAKMVSADMVVCFCNKFYVGVSYYKHHDLRYIIFLECIALLLAFFNMILHTNTQ